jgi:hypothetical protein
MVFTAKAPPDIGEKKYDETAVRALVQFACIDNIMILKKLWC